MFAAVHHFPEVIVLKIELRLLEFIPSTIDHVLINEEFPSVGESCVQSQTFKPYKIMYSPGFNLFGI